MLRELGAIIIMLTSVSCLSFVPLIYPRSQSYKAANSLQNIWQAPTFELNRVARCFSLHIVIVLFALLIRLRGVLFIFQRFVLQIIGRIIGRKYREFPQFIEKCRHSTLRGLRLVTRKLCKLGRVILIHCTNTLELNIRNWYDFFGFTI